MCTLYITLSILSCKYDSNCIYFKHHLQPTPIALAGNFIYPVHIDLQAPLTAFFTAYTYIYYPIALTGNYIYAVHMGLQTPLTGQSYIALTGCYIYLVYTIQASLIYPYILLCTEACLPYPFFALY